MVSGLTDSIRKTTSTAKFYPYSAHGFCRLQFKQMTRDVKVGEKIFPEDSLGEKNGRVKHLKVHNEVKEK